MQYLTLVTTSIAGKQNQKKYLQDIVHTSKIELVCYMLHIFISSLTFKLTTLLLTYKLSSFKCTALQVSLLYIQNAKEGQYEVCIPNRRTFDETNYWI